MDYAQLLWDMMHVYADMAGIIEEQLDHATDTGAMPFRLAQARKRAYDTLYTHADTAIQSYSLDALNSQGRAHNTVKAWSRFALAARRALDLALTISLTSLNVVEDRLTYDAEAAIYEAELVKIALYTRQAKLAAGL